MLLLQTCKRRTLSLCVTDKATQESLSPSPDGVFCQHKGSMVETCSRAIIRLNQLFVSLHTTFPQSLPLSKGSSRGLTTRSAARAPHACLLRVQLILIISFFFSSPTSPGHTSQTIIQSLNAAPRTHRTVRQLEDTTSEPNLLLLLGIYATGLPWPVLHAEFAPK